VAHGLISDRELAEIVAYHLGLDLDAVEDLAVVDAHDAADHFGHDDHVSQVCFHRLGLVHGPASLLRPAQSSYEALGLRLEPAVDAAPRARMDKLGELLVVQVEELLELDAAEQELAEGALLAERSRALHIGLVHGDRDSVRDAAPARGPRVAPRLPPLPSLSWIFCPRGSLGGVSLARHLPDPVPLALLSRCARRFGALSLTVNRFRTRRRTADLDARCSCSWLRQNREDKPLAR